MNVPISIKSLLPLITPRVRYAVGAIAAAGAVVAFAARSGDAPTRALPANDAGASPAAAVAFAGSSPRRMPIGIPAVASLPATATAPAPATLATSPAPLLKGDAGALPAEYSILLHRSMFSRRPGEAAAEDEQPADPSREHRPEAALILRGISDENGTFKAFVEDLRGSRIWRLTAGDPIGRGRLAEISFSGVRYETGSGRITDVSIGCTFDGVASASAQPPLPLGLDGNGAAAERKLKRKLAKIQGDPAAADGGAAQKQLPKELAARVSQKDR